MTYEALIDSLDVYKTVSELLSKGSVFLLQYLYGFT